MAEAPKRGRRVTKDDFRKIAEFVHDELARRIRIRRESRREEYWDEVDRQLRMEEKPSNIDIKTGRPVPGSAWMPFLELPWQAETHELLLSDVRRLMWPTERNYFSAHANDTDEVLAAIELSGVERTGLPGPSNQENLNAIVEGVHLHFQDQYEFRDEWDKMHSDALSYGTFVGRARRVKLEKFDAGFRGTKRNSRRMPVLMHQPIRNTYLDDSPAAIMREGHLVAPAHMFVFWQNVDDLALAAKKGAKDPEAEDGGWMPENLKGIESGRRDNNVKLVEYEGDLLVPRSSGPSLFLPNVIATVVIGVDDKNHGVARVVRYREREFPFRSYIVQDYHNDDADSPYGTSPLMKGRPIQAAGSEAYSRMIQAAILQTEPPLKYDYSDPYFAQQGGPNVAPRAQWPTIGTVEPVEIGNLEALLALWQGLKAEYQDVTGTKAPRLGQQTKSHQTAFAVDTELQRGVIRTVDYVRSVEHGAVRTWLSMELEMIRKSLPDDGLSVYIPKYRSWLTVTPDMLPEEVTYDVHGAAGPLEEQEQAQKRMTSLQLFAQAEQMAVQLGFQPSNWNEIRRQILREGFSDIEPFVNESNAGAPVGPAPAAPAEPAGEGAAESRSPNELVRLAAGNAAPGRA